MRQQHQRVVEALPHVDVLDRRLVEVGVRLEGLHDRGDPTRALRDLASEVPQPRGRPQELQGARQVRLLGDVGQRIEIIGPNAGLDQLAGHPPRGVDVARGQPDLHRLLGVGGLHGPCHGTWGQLSQQCDGRSPGGGVARGRRELADAVDAGAHLGSRPRDGRGGVVQLVGDPGRERAQLGQPLGLPQLIVGRAKAGEEGAEHLLGSGGTGAQQVVQRGLRDPDQLEVGAGTSRRVAWLHLDQGHLPDDLAVTANGQPHLPAFGGLEHLHFTADDDVGVLAGVALVEQRLAGDEGHVRDVRADPCQVVVAESREQGDGTQAFEVSRHQAPARYSCTSDTVIEPMPTADATRLTAPSRTSPAANTPGTLVSSG